MGAFKDLTNKKFNKLLVMHTVGKDKHGYYLWKCLCDCGNIKIATGQSVKIGDCGCLYSDKLSLSHIKHGGTKDYGKSREYTSWSGAKYRCTNPNNPKYPIYGGLGIKMCRRWMSSFEAFFKDMGPCPPGHSLDRINFRGDYKPSNCRWATRYEQQQNRGVVKLKAKDVLDIRALAAKGIEFKSLAKVFNTAEGNIWSIVNRKTWCNI